MTEKTEAAIKREMQELNSYLSLAQAKGGDPYFLLSKAMNKIVGWASEMKGNLPKASVMDYSE